MKNNPLVSIIMPVFNAEKFLRKSIESILNQTYKNFEFIIIDDGSTDGSREIIKDYAKTDRRINFVKNEMNLGQTRTVKRGIKLARGKYFFKIDNDDLAHKDRLKLITEFLENNNNYVVVGSNIKIINEKGKIIGYRIYPETDKEIRTRLFYKSPFASPVVGIRMDILKKIFLMDELILKFNYAGDYILWYKILKYGRGANLREFLLNYRIRDDQVKSKKTKEQLKETIEIQKIIFKYEKNTPLLARLNHLLLKLFFLLPSRIIIFLFKMIEYKKR